ncbi:MAG: hypothetical protein COB84_09630 [Rhodobacteraceae bacterium]|nr:MAG: hypothetical protein COB84_09630 [Paracoccaceae bacterium]
MFRLCAVITETALAHKVGNKVERSYARSDMLGSRATLMDAWAEFVTGGAKKCTKTLKTPLIK